MCKTCLKKTPIEKTQIIHIQMLFFLQYYKNKTTTWQKMGLQVYRHNDSNFYISSIQMDEIFYTKQSCPPQ